MLHFHLVYPIGHVINAAASPAAPPDRLFQPVALTIGDDFYRMLVRVLKSAASTEAFSSRRLSQFVGRVLCSVAHCLDGRVPVDAFLACRVIAALSAGLRDKSVATAFLDAFKSNAEASEGFQCVSSILAYASNAAAAAAAAAAADPDVTSSVSSVPPGPERPKWAAHLWWRRVQPAGNTNGALEVLTQSPGTIHSPALMKPTNQSPWAHDAASGLVTAVLQILELLSSSEECCKTLLRVTCSLLHIQASAPPPAILLLPGAARELVDFCALCVLQTQSLAAWFSSSASTLTALCGILAAPGFEDKERGSSVDADATSTLRGLAAPDPALKLALRSASLRMARSTGMESATSDGLLAEEATSTGVWLSTAALCDSDRTAGVGDIMRLPVPPILQNGASAGPSAFSSCVCRSHVSEGTVASHIVSHAPPLPAIGPLSLVENRSSWNITIVLAEPTILTAVVVGCIQGR